MFSEWDTVESSGEEERSSEPNFRTSPDDKIKNNLTSPVGGESTSRGRSEGSLKRKPMGRNTFGCSAPSAFFVLTFRYQFSAGECDYSGSERDQMNESKSQMTQQLARVASALQQKRTGVAPKGATAMLSQNTLVVTMEDALTRAEKALARTPQGAAQVQEFHRQLFASSSESLREKIKSITGRDVREATAEIETDTGAIAHAFKSGAMVQVFLLTPEADSYKGSEREAMERADDDGFHPLVQVADSERNETTE